MIGFAVASLLGFTYWGIKQPDQKVVLAKNTDAAVCTQSDIDAYNAIVLTFPANEAEQDKKISDFSSLATTIKQREGFSDDASCVFMAYSVAIQEGNQNEAQAHYATLVTLNEKGLFPINTILDVTSLQSMKDRIDALQYVESEDDQSQLGSG